jgi:hypothetical protein
MFLLVYVLSVVVNYALMIPLFIVMAVAMQKSLAGPTPPLSFIISMEAVFFGVSFLVQAFVMPIYTIALMLFYFDQRTRQEGFDIEQLMSQAGWSELPPAASAPPQYAPPPFASSVSEASSAPLAPAPPFAPAPFTPPAPAENSPIDAGPAPSQSDPAPPAPEDTRE